MAIGIYQHVATSAFRVDIAWRSGAAWPSASLDAGGFLGHMTIKEKGGSEGRWHLLQKWPQLGLIDTHTLASMFCSLLISQRPAQGLLLSACPRQEHSCAV